MWLERQNGFRPAVPETHRKTCLARVFGEQSDLLHGWKDWGVPSLRSSQLRSMPIGRRQLEWVLGVYAGLCNRVRPHRGLEFGTPIESQSRTDRGAAVVLQSDANSGPVSSTSTRQWRDGSGISTVQPVTILSCWAVVGDAVSPRLESRSSRSDKAPPNTNTLRISSRPPLNPAHGFLYSTGLVRPPSRGPTLGPRGVLMSSE